MIFVIAQCLQQEESSVIKRLAMQIQHTPSALFSASLPSHSVKKQQLEYRVGFGVYSCVLLPWLSLGSWCSTAKLPDEQLRLLDEESDLATRRCWTSVAVFWSVCSLATHIIVSPISPEGSAMHRSASHNLVISLGLPGPK